MITTQQIADDLEKMVQDGEIFSRAQAARLVKWALAFGMSIGTVIGMVMLSIFLKAVGLL